MSFTLRFLAATLAMGCAVAFAQADYPARPITLVVPWGAGGATDMAARALAEKLQASMGQPVLVENKTGANGGIATTYVAQAAPDGYTVQVGGISLTINQWVYKTQRYDLMRDLQQVSMLAGNDNVLLVPADSPARSVADLVQLLRKKGSASNYASAGVGASTHLTAELFKLVHNLDATHIPFKGSAMALVEVVAGRVDFMFDNIAAAAGHIKGGRARALAVTGAARDPLLPDVPTLKELGMDVQVTSWTNIMVPAKTPRPIVERLHAEITKALKSDEIRERFAKASLRPIIVSPEQTTEIVRSELAKWKPVVERAGLKQD